MKYTDLVTQRLNARIPRCACDLWFGKDHVWYLHPRKGWKRINYKKMGLKPNDDA